MKIRTVFQPDVDVEVDEAEAEALRLQGLLYEPPPAPAAAPEQVSLKGDSGPELVELPPGRLIARPAAANPDPPAADTAPTDQAPPDQKG